MMMMCVLISDSTLTTVNVTSVMELVKDWDSLIAVVSGTVDIIPDHRLDAIRSSCSNNREVASECASYYVCCHPWPSWTHLARHLYDKEQLTAVEKCKPFLPLRGKYQVVTYAGMYHTPQANTVHASEFHLEILARGGKSGDHRNKRGQQQK